MLHRGLRVRDCDCGAAEQGHAPDCSFLLSCDAAEARFQGESEVAAVRFCEAVRGWGCMPADMRSDADAALAMDASLDEAGAGHEPYRCHVRREAWRRAEAAGYDPEKV